MGLEDGTGMLASSLSFVIGGEVDDPVVVGVVSGLTG